ncbi:MAG: hypothetical protein HLX51_00940 [Micrococcaceae bacterium]|nr:hypothetical protein [Micrococcaceae bacterium]
MTVISKKSVRQKPTTPSTVDDIVSQIARNVLIGEQAESHGRSKILSCLIGSHAITAMVDQCRRQMPTSGEVMLDAVRSECEKRLKSKVLSDDGTGVDLLTFTSASATGWAERFLKSGANWIFSNATRTVREDATDPHFMSTTDIYGADSTTLTSSAIHREVYAWLEEATSTRKKLNPARSAVALRVIYGLPDVIRPDPRTRQRIVNKLNNDPASAYQAARYQLYIVLGRPVPKDRLDHDMLALWDDYTPDQLHRLISTQMLAPSQIAIPGCADFLRPSQKEIKAFTGRVMKAAGKTSKQQRDIIRQSLTGFIETEFSLHQLTGAAHKRTVAQRTEHQQRYRKHFHELNQATASLNTGLGATPMQVYRTMFTLAEPMIHEYQVSDEFHVFTTTDNAPQEVAS